MSMLFGRSSSKDVLDEKFSNMTDEEKEDLAAAMKGLEAEASSADVVESESKSVDSDVETDFVSDVKTSSELLERETTIGTKSTQFGGYVLEDSDGNRYDSLENTDKVDSRRIGGVVTKGEDGKNHYSGTLGDFDYDPDEFVVGVKKVNSAEGVTAEIPVLRYIGKKTNGDEITIPDGLKSLDYTFEGNKKLETVPYIPDSVESAHAAFMGCKTITMASKLAKDGERRLTDDGKEIGGITGAALGGTGLVGGAIVGAKGLAIGGTAVAGPLGGVAGALIGGLGGAFVGGIGGFAAGSLASIDNDGKGGTWTMPKGLKDASYMFSGCESLTEAYESANDALINARGMYRGTKDIGTDAYATKHGSVSVTDFTDSKLSKESVQGSYDGTNVEITSNLDGNWSKDWDEASGTLNRSGITSEEKAEVENLNQVLKAEDVKNGLVETEMSNATGGLAYSAKKRTETGYQTTMDINDKNTPLASTFGSLGSLVDRGLVSFAEFKLLKMVTGSTLLSAGITFGGQMLGILPKSVKPVLSTVAGFVGTDNVVGKALNGIVDKIPDTEDSGGLLSAFGKSKTTDAVASVSNSMSNSVQVASGSNTMDITASMENNGRSVVNNGIILDVGKGKASSNIEDLTKISTLAAASIEERAITMAGDDQVLSESDKAALSENVMNVMCGMEAYNKGAARAIGANYGTTENAMVAENGLARVMSVTVNPLYQSIQELNAKYDFLSEHDLQKLNSMNFTGVGTYGNYLAANGQSVSVNRDPSTSVLDGYSDDEIMFANAGLDDPLESSDFDDKGLEQKSDQMIVKASGKSKSDEKSEKSSDKKMTQEERLAAIPDSFKIGQKNSEMDVEY